jgi:hypothetical protein
MVVDFRATIPRLHYTPDQHSCQDFNIKTNGGGEDFPTQTEDAYYKSEFMK